MRWLLLVCVLVAGCGEDVNGGSDMAMGNCGNATCKSGELCVPGCRGICGCDPLPDGGTCANGPCSCGRGCELAPPAPYCSPNLPQGCQYVNGVIQCLCA
jgi:hypothetical protein